MFPIVSNTGKIESTNLITQSSSAYFQSNISKAKNKPQWIQAINPTQQGSGGSSASGMPICLAWVKRLSKVVIAEVMKNAMVSPITSGESSAAENSESIG